MKAVPYRLAMQSSTFYRFEYTDLPQYHRNWGYSSRDGTGTGWWLMDWPDADNHFTIGITRLTRIDAGDPRHVRLTDDASLSIPGSTPHRPVGGGCRMLKRSVCANISCEADSWLWMIFGDPNSGKCFVRP